MNEYVVIEAYSREDFQKKVISAMNCGWNPIGGVTITNSNTHSSLTYAQAMVR